MMKYIFLIILFLFSISNGFASAQPRFANYTLLEPQANRTPVYADYLDVSVRIHYGRISGSGTIIYYDNKNNTAFVASCGHLWDQNATRNQCTIVSFYQNKIRRQAKSYTGRCLFYDNAADVSLVIFKPDWKPSYFVIAPFDAEVGKTYVSTGCDHASEVAAYIVKISNKEKDGSLISIPGPRPGRSGGGLLQNSYYVGTCVRTSDESGNGYGIYVGLPAVREVYKKHGYGWLLSLRPYDFAQRIPIRSHTNPNKEYPKNWIVIP